MVVFRDLKGLMDIIISWEKKLSEFYETSEAVVSTERCRQIIGMLKTNHDKNLGIIEDLRVENFGKDEWVQITPDINVKKLLPTECITCDSTPQEITHYVLEFEIQLKDFYSSIADRIVTREEKELFESLVMFKDHQIMKIKQSMDV